MAIYFLLRRHLANVSIVLFHAFPRKMVETVVWFKNLQLILEMKWSRGGQAADLGRVLKKSKKNKKS